MESSKFAANELKQAYKNQKRANRRRIALEDLAEATKQGYEGTGKDSVLETTKRDFGLDGIGSPVTVWHGDADSDVGLVEANHIYNSLNNSKHKALRILPNETHTLIRRHWGAILEQLVIQSACTSML